MDRFTVKFWTWIGTIAVVLLVAGASIPAPAPLRFMLVALGVALLAYTFWGIFEWLEILDRRRYTFDPGSGPDGGERAPKRIDNVTPFPRRAA